MTEMFCFTGSLNAEEQIEKKQAGWSAGFWWCWCAWDFSQLHGAGLVGSWRQRPKGLLNWLDVGRHGMELPQASSQAVLKTAFSFLKVLKMVYSVLPKSVEIILHAWLINIVGRNCVHAYACMYMYVCIQSQSFASLRATSHLQHCPSAKSAQNVLDAGKMPLSVLFASRHLFLSLSCIAASPPLCWHSNLQTCA